LKRNENFAERSSSPLDFLAQASMSVDQPVDNKWVTTVSDGREKITVVPGPAGPGIRLHKGSGRLPPIDLSKPFAKKCRNRECNNWGGQPGKPRSIYCSKRCQSREQNLRQGRIKNVRSPTTLSAPGTPSAVGGSNTPPVADRMDRTRSESLSPRSSPDMMMEDGRSSSPELEVSSPASPVNFGPSPVPFDSTTLSPSPIVPMMQPVAHHSNSMAPPTNSMTPSPLNIRLGMTPSPLPSPSPISMVNNHASSFSPVPMGMHTPIFLPRPAAVHGSSFSVPGTPSQPKEKNIAFQSNTFSPPQANSPRDSEERKELTLAPILS